jgi:hypothetical protein
MVSKRDPRCHEGQRQRAASADDVDPVFHAWSLLGEPQGGLRDRDENTARMSWRALTAIKRNDCGIAIF